MAVEADFVLRGAGRLVTCDPNLGPGPLGVIENASVAAHQGKIVWVGRESDLKRNVEIGRGAAELDARGNAVLPGLVDCHTHLLFAGDRSEEFVSRVVGEPYTGGGIMKTVIATRTASNDELLALAGRRLDAFAAFGVTTVEVKSGYGLTPDQEVRLVDLSRSISHEGAEIISTFMGAHVVPEDHRGDSDGYVDQVTTKMLPRAKKSGAEFCDVWVDKGAFTVEQGRRILTAARAAGFGLKVHAEQLSRSGGAMLASELRATSADHLEHATDEDAGALAEAGCVAVLLPGASLTTGSPFAPARTLIDHGVRVAISTDFNPGTSYTENLQLMIFLACMHMKMTPEEAIAGVTSNAAAALGREGSCGVIAPGARCDLVMLDALRENDLAYHYGVNLAAAVVKQGKLYKL